MLRKSYTTLHFDLQVLDLIGFFIRATIERERLSAIEAYLRHLVARRESDPNGQRLPPCLQVA